MRKSKFTIGLLLFGLGFGTSISAHAASWETVLSCDQGAAILQVNKDNRRNYQFVIKDPNILVYFNGSGAFRNAGSNFGNGRELIVGNYLHFGIYDGGQFQEGDGHYNYGDSFLLRREGPGMKIILRNIHAWTHCYGNVSPSTGMCDGKVDSGVNIREYADWYFQQCE